MPQTAHHMQKPVTNSTVFEPGDFLVAAKRLRRQQNSIISGKWKEKPLQIRYSNPTRQALRVQKVKCCRRVRLSPNPSESRVPCTYGIASFIRSHTFGEHGSPVRIAVVQAQFARQSGWTRMRPVGGQKDGDDCCPARRIRKVSGHPLWIISRGSLI